MSQYLDNEYKYEDVIKSLTSKLKEVKETESLIGEGAVLTQLPDCDPTTSSYQAESRAEEAERNNMMLENKIDKLEGEWPANHWASRAVSRQFLRWSR